MLTKAIVGMRIHIIAQNQLGTIGQSCNCGCKTCFVRYDHPQSYWRGGWYRYDQLEAIDLSPEEQDRHRRAEHAEQYL